MFIEKKSDHTKRCTSIYVTGTYTYICTPHVWCVYILYICCLFLVLSDYITYDILWSFLFSPSKHLSMSTENYIITCNVCIVFHLFTQLQIWECPMSNDLYVNNFQIFHSIIKKAMVSIYSSISIYLFIIISFIP